MSITTTEQDVQPRSDPYKIPTDSKRAITRSPSIEKIIKFNTYICSQSFYILPSLLAWLKTSQTVLKSYAEKCIATTKSAIYSTTLYKILEAQFTIIYAILKDVSLSDPKQILPGLKAILIELRRSLEEVPERFKRKILKTTVYFSFFFIFLQLFLCLWTLSGVIVPLGLTFLLGCLTLISYANFQCLRFVIIEELLKDEDRGRCASTHVSRKYVRRRDILGKRTISNVKLF